MATDHKFTAIEVTASDPHNEGELMKIIIPVHQFFDKDWFDIGLLSPDRRDECIEKVNANWFNGSQEFKDDFRVVEDRMRYHPGTTTMVPNGKAG